VKFLNIKLKTLPSYQSHIFVRTATKLTPLWQLIQGITLSLLDGTLPFGENP
jgi:hypothetical protein